MNRRQGHPVGFTLVELMVSVAIIASLVAIMIPAARSMRKSYESTGGEAMVNSALASARAIAAKERQYAGVRFQLEYKDNTYPVTASQYMIFVVHDFNATNLSNGFRAVEGLKPIKLPDCMMVLEARDLDTDYTNFYNDSATGRKERNDLTTFTVVFSPSGKLMIHGVRVRNNAGQSNPQNIDPLTFGSNDSIFNSIKNIEDFDTGQFVQDDYNADGFEEELSVNRFVICNRERFKSMDSANRWIDYLKGEQCFINAYTGTLIKNKN